VPLFVEQGITSENYRFFKTLINYHKKSILVYDHIHPLPQLPQALKRHNFPWSQHHTFTDSRVSPFPFRFFLTQNFPKPLIKTSSPDTRVLFDDLKKGFDCFNSFFLGQFVLGADYLDDLHFG